MTPPIGVLIVDDQPMVRAGLRMILELEPDIDIVGEAADGNEAVDRRRRARTRRHPDGRADAAPGRAGGDPPHRPRPGAAARAYSS